MSDHNIATSQHLLKRLEEEINFLNSLMSQMLIVVWGMTIIGTKSYFKPAVALQSY